jgi:hypothetical protein
MDSCAFDPAVWAEEHFGAAQLGDMRLTRRLVESATRAARQPGGSLPQMMQDPAALDGFYRLVDRGPVTHAAVIAGHVERTQQRMRACPNPVLILKDTTELDFTTHTTLRQIGPIGNGSRRGYLCHNALAVDAKTQEVLGLADQRLFVRPRRTGARSSRSRTAVSRPSRSRTAARAVAESDITSSRPVGPHSSGRGVALAQ